MDRLRVDVGAEFYVRVEATEVGVTTAAQALAGKTFRASDLAETLEGKLVNCDAVGRSRLQHGEPAGRACEIHLAT